MKKLLTLIAICLSTISFGQLKDTIVSSFSQDTIIFKDKGLVLCRIRNITPGNIFYISQGEYLSDFMYNVKYHSKFPNQNQDCININNAGKKTEQKIEQKDTIQDNHIDDTKTINNQSNSTEYHVGPRGGIYHYSKNGKKVYSKK